MISYILRKQKTNTLKGKYSDFSDPSGYSGSTPEAPKWTQKCLPTSTFTHVMRYFSVIKRHFCQCFGRLCLNFLAISARDIFPNVISHIIISMVYEKAMEWDKIIRLAFQVMHCWQTDIFESSLTVGVHTSSQQCLKHNQSAFLTGRLWSES